MKKVEIKTREGLPKEAFAIGGDPEDPDAWKLPHHQRSIFRALRGKLDVDKTVDWELMQGAVAALSVNAYRRRQLEASPEEILGAATHLADHYRKTNKALPDILAALA